MEKILISTSFSFYPKLEPVIKSLEKLGFEVLTPSGYGEEAPAYRIRKLSEEEFVKVKQELFKKDDKHVTATDVLLVMNYDKPDSPNYIGGAVFLEMFRAYQQGKPIYLYNSIPKNNFKDEIRGLAPAIINKDLTKIKK